MNVPGELVSWGSRENSIWTRRSKISSESRRPRAKGGRRPHFKRQRIKIETWWAYRSSRPPLGIKELHLSHSRNRETKTNRGQENPSPSPKKQGGRDQAAHITSSSSEKRPRGRLVKIGREARSARLISPPARSGKYPGAMIQGG